MSNDIGSIAIIREELFIPQLICMLSDPQERPRALAPARAPVTQLLKRCGGTGFHLRECSRGDPKPFPGACIKRGASRPALIPHPATSLPRLSD